MKNVPPDVKDLILKLLVYEPSQRLGSGRDFASLKSHIFFKGIDFKNLHLTDAPYMKAIQKRNTATFSMPTDFVFAYSTADSNDDEVFLSRSDRKSESRFNIYKSVFLKSTRSSLIIYEGKMIL